MQFSPPDNNKQQQVSVVCLSSCCWNSSCARPCLVRLIQPVNLPVTMSPASFSQNFFFFVMSPFFNSTHFVPADTTDDSDAVDVCVGGVFLLLPRFLAILYLFGSEFAIFTSLNVSSFYRPIFLSVIMLCIMFFFSQFFFLCLFSTLSPDIECIWRFFGFSMAIFDSASFLGLSPMSVFYSTYCILLWWFLGFSMSSSPSSILPYLLNLHQFLSFIHTVSPTTNHIINQSPH